MSPRTFCQTGQGERVKAGVHALAAAVLGLMALYNGVSFVYRRESHLKWHAVLYGLATGYEVKQVMRHMERW